MGFYTEIRDSVAGPLIEGYGMALTLTRITEGAYDPDTGQNAASSTTTHSCNGLVDEYKENMIAASLVRQGDKRLLLSAKGLSVTPMIGDRFTFPDGSIWYIPEGTGQLQTTFQPIQTIAPAGIPVIYIIQVRK